MKLLEKPIRADHSTSKTNALEDLLYSNDVISKNANNISHPYERGMLISISNYSTYWEDIRRNYKRQYQSIIKVLTGKKISRDDIQQTDRLPKRKTISNLVYYKLPIVVGAIHDNKQDDAYGGKSSRYKQYQHSHFYIYNTHHYLPDKLKDLNNKLSKLKSYLLRFTNSKYGKQGTVHISPVGTGKYVYNDIVTPTNLYDYLSLPDTAPNKPAIINYIKENRHNPLVNYPLTFIYYRLNQL